MTRLERGRHRSDEGDARCGGGAAILLAYPGEPPLPPAYPTGALATVVGVLIEVPVMLLVRHGVDRSKDWYEHEPVLREAHS